MNDVSAVSIDLAKNVFGIKGQDSSGRVILSKRIRRGKLLKTLTNLPSCLVGMESCAGSNYWAREIRKLGHQVKLIAPQHVKPYLRGNKNDGNDALAICEAMQRPSIPEVAVKTPEQQAMQSYLRTRRLLIQQRTACSNAMRGHLLEFGIISRTGHRALMEMVREALGNKALPGLLRESLQVLYSQYLFLGEQLDMINRLIQQAARNNELARKLMEIPGIGPICAMALIAGVGDAQMFRSGRQMSAWMGIVPRQYSSGDRQVLQGISKRGDTYLRTLMIHGARSALRTARKDPHLDWARQVARRRHNNKAVVALANKNVRVVWKLMTTDETYRHAA